MSAASTGEREHLRRMAAAAAVGEVRNGMVVGLGTGRTAMLAIELLGERVARGLGMVGIATSERSAILAEKLGIPLTDFAAHRRIDLAIDGADEVETATLDLLKGRGGALLREKIVASASDRVVIIIDDGKLVDRLARRAPVPVEIVRFGWQVVVDRLTDFGIVPRLRIAEGGEPFRTDGDNLIVDCGIPEAVDLTKLDEFLSSQVGVIETGLFFGLASRVIVGTPGGIKTLER